VKLIDMTMGDFLAALGSASPAPGGGSAAALAGAVGAALCGMAARMTEGKEKFRASQADMEKVRREAGEQETLLRRLVDEDTAAFLAVMAARKLPRSTPQEQAARRKAVQDAVARAARVPASTLAAIRALSALARLAAERGNPACITDVGTAAVMLRAGAAAAAWNVRVNLPSLDDAALREELDRRTGEDLVMVFEDTGKTEQLVDKRLAGPAVEN